jgi:hypothetical protein
MNTFSRSMWTLFLLFGAAVAHGGHEAVPQGESVSKDPIVCSATRTRTGSGTNVQSCRMVSYGRI